MLQWLRTDTLTLIIASPLMIWHSIERHDSDIRLPYTLRGFLFHRYIMALNANCYTTKALAHHIFKINSCYTIFNCGLSIFNKRILLLYLCYITPPIHDSFFAAIPNKPLLFLCSVCSTSTAADKNSRQKYV